MIRLLLVCAMCGKQERRDLRFGDSEPEDVDEPSRGELPGATPDEPEPPPRRPLWTCPDCIEVIKRDDDTRARFVKEMSVRIARAEDDPNTLKYRLVRARRPEWKH